MDEEERGWMEGKRLTSTIRERKRAREREKEERREEKMDVEDKKGSKSS